MATTLAAAAAPMSPAPPRRRGRPPKKPAPAPAPRSPSPVSPLAAAAEEATAVKAEAEAEGYEREREERIRENMERMQKLGLLDLSFQLNQAASASPASGRALRSRSATPCYPPAARERLSAAPPARRSLRLKSVSPVSYSESCITKDKNLDHGSSDLIEKGSKEEVYTEEHEKLLGTCEATWTLFVDGYGKDGKRIYDQVRGQTCHQCRQKTLGHHTHCSQCKIVQGQFCGDCLYMRYGENVLEAKKNPNWICPVCRGICNCSLCRTKKGWFPTGSLYRKVVSLGYKSVAHYLIQTRRSSAGSADSNSADSSNKLLPCTKSATSSTSENYPVADHESESAEMSSKIDNEESKMQGKSSEESKDEITKESQGKNANGCEDESRSESAVPSSALDCQANQDTGSDTPAKGRPKKRKLIERSPDCVATRLRSRSNKS